VCAYLIFLVCHYSCILVNSLSSLTCVKHDATSWTSFNAGLRTIMWSKLHWLDVPLHICVWLCVAVYEGSWDQLYHTWMNLSPKLRLFQHYCSVLWIILTGCSIQSCGKSSIGNEEMQLPTRNEDDATGTWQVPDGATTSLRRLSKYQVSRYKIMNVIFETLLFQLPWTVYIFC